MAAIDVFASSLFEEAKRFLEQAIEKQKDSSGNIAYLHAALMIGFCSLEAHINAIAEEFAAANDNPHEKGLLLEREVRLVNGQFEVTNSLKMQRLEERIEFLQRKYSVTPLDKQSAHWNQFKHSLNLRNEITHPKNEVILNNDSVTKALGAILEIINDLYESIYQRPYPLKQRGLQSKLDF